MLSDAKDYLSTRNGALTVGLAVLAIGTVFVRSPGTEEFLQFGVLGLAEGAIFATAAAGIVLTYTTTGVFNFAHGAVGMISAYLYWMLLNEVGLPAPIALVVVIGIIAPLIGLLLERVLRSFKDAPASLTLTVTIAITILLIGVAQFAFPTDNGELRQLSLLFGDRTVSIFGANISWDSLFFVVVAAVTAVGLRLLLFVSRTGTAMRAVVDNPDLAALNGAPPKAIARYSWVLGSVLAAVAGVLLAGGLVLSPIQLTFFVVSAYGAAIFGRLKSLPLTFLGAIVLGLTKNWFALGGVLPEGAVFDKIKLSVPGLFLFMALLLLPEDKLSVGRVVGRDEPRVPGLIESAIRVAPFLLVVVVAGQMIPDEYLGDAARGMIYALLMLSLVLLTGYGGQISLAQYVFFGLGAFAMGKTFPGVDEFGDVAGGTSPVGLLAAAAICVPIGAIVAVPALRLKGLYLALVTFALASVSKNLIFQQDAVFGLQAVKVGRLEMLGLDFSGPRMFLFLCALIFAAVGVGVLALRRGPFGRRLAALRDSEAACATLGLDVRRTKLTVFVISAAIAGLAGALFGGLNSTASDIQFEPENNIVLFLFAFVGGITTVTGALIGGILFALLPLVQSEATELAGLVFAAVAVAAILLGRQPNGMAGLLYERISNLIPDRKPSAKPKVPPSGSPAAPEPSDELEEVAAGAPS